MNRKGSNNIACLPALKRGVAADINAVARKYRLHTFPPRKPAKSGVYLGIDRYDKAQK